MPLIAATNKILSGASLSAAEAQSAFDAIFTGHVPEDQIGAFLLALHEKGETSDEILGAVTSMRAKAVTIKAPPDAIDIVGTGGDSRGTYNISTAAALVVAACGVPVAKHGNRASTSKSGSSDVLAALGINLEPGFVALEHCLAEANICFLFAPQHHPAMKHVIVIRKKLAVRTIFNLLGPLTNPANVTQHLIGAYAKEWLRPMAEVLRSLGSSAGWFTHGHDGLDEITTMADSDIVTLKDGNIEESTLSLNTTGIPKPTLAQLQGGDAAANAVALQNLLKGEKNAYRDIVALNAAAALVVANKSSDIRQGLTLVAAALDSGAAHATLQKLIEVTNRVTI